MKHPGAGEFVPRSRSVRTLARAARACEGCDLFAPATQTVFGRGDPKASIMLVGEQPGDHEDLEGEAFVGPAGQLLVRAVAAAGLQWDALWVTNAVKHFRFEQRGKRRIHQKPTASQTTACRPWLDAELAAVHPRVVVALGSTATQSIFGSGFALTEHRGTVHEWPHGQPGDWPHSHAGGDPGDGSHAARAVIVTFHPSAALRAPDASRRTEVYTALVDDLRLAKARVRRLH